MTELKRLISEENAIDIYPTRRGVVSHRVTWLGIGTGLAVAAMALLWLGRGGSQGWKDRDGAPDLPE